MAPLNASTVEEDCWVDSCYRCDIRNQFGSIRLGGEVCRDYERFVAERFNDFVDWMRIEVSL